MLVGASHCHQWRKIGSALLLVASAALGGGCTPVRAVAGEQCRNGLDDDFDGKTDCRDTDCVREWTCTVEPPFDPELPAWIDDMDESPDLGLSPSFDDECDELAIEDREVYAVGCRPDPDDCGEGLRCVPLQIGGEVVETGCVRRGCAAPFDPCTRIDALGRRAFATACGEGTSCAPGPSACGEAPCCAPLCRLEGDPQCERCVPLSWSWGPIAPTVDELAGLGVCAD